MRRTAAAVIPVALASALAAPAAATAQDRTQSTELISHALGGGLPNGPSTNAVISGDKRYARVIAFQSQASNLVRNDRNGQMDVFAVIRRGANNRGTPWRGGGTRLISRTRSGAPANGPSYAPAVGGGFHSRPKCIAFLSAASNIVPRDTNGKVDAFISRGPGRKPARLALPGNRQSHADASGVAVSGNCARIAWVAGGKLYVRAQNRTRRVRVPGAAADPSFSTGIGNDLVFAARRGVYLSRGGTGRPRLIARGGSNPAYNDVKRHAVAYEFQRGGITQIAYKDLGKRAHVISARRGHLGNGASRHPVIGNSGFYVTFQTEATNLGTTASGATGDGNGRPDIYLYSDVRDITLAESVKEKGIPAGGQNPSMSFYANYIVFDSPAPIGSVGSPHQVYMRYLGGI
jgi:hypothetical protein